MPHALLHLSSVRLLEQDPNVHPLGREAVRRARGMALLGALLPDLPHFTVEGLRGEPLQLRGGLPLPPADPEQGPAWVTRLHAGRPMAAILAVLQRPADADRPGPLSRLALGLGLAAHAAMDVALAPLVAGLVKQHGLDSPHVPELVQWLSVHGKLTGSPADEDPELWDALSMVGAPDPNRAVAHVQAALEQAGDGTPTPTHDHWMAWLDGLDAYLERVRGGLRGLEAGGLDEPTLRTRYVDQPGFLELFVQAQARCVAWANRLCMAFETGDIRPDTTVWLREHLPECALQADTDPFAGSAVAFEIAAQREHAERWTKEGQIHRPRDTTALGAPPPLPKKGKRHAPEPAPLPVLQGTPVGAATDAVAQLESVTSLSDQAEQTMWNQPTPPARPMPAAADPPPPAAADPPPPAPEAAAAPADADSPDLRPSGRTPR